MPIAALVLGIIGLVLSLVPCLGMYAMPLTVLAVILGALGMKAATGRGMAIAGLVCGIIGSCIAAWWIYAVVVTKGATEEGFKQFETELKAAAAKAEKDMKKADQDMQKKIEEANAANAAAVEAAPAAPAAPAANP